MYPGVSGCVLFWIIRPIKPALWDTETDIDDEFEKTYYQLEQIGFWWDSDRLIVFQILHASCHQNPQAWAWLKPHEATQDGHQAWTELYTAQRGRSTSHAFSRCTGVQG